MNILCTVVAESHLPKQELSALPQKVVELRAGLKHLNKVDRLGAELSIFLNTAYYVFCLNYFHLFRRAYRNGINGPEWTGLKSLENDKQQYLRKTFEAQEPGFGKDFLINAAPAAALLLVTLFSLKTGLLIVLTLFIAWSLYGIFRAAAPPSLRKRIDESKLGEYAHTPLASTTSTALKHLRPFFNIGIFLSVYGGVLMMLFHWLARLTGWHERLQNYREDKPGSLVLAQNLPALTEREENFFDSPVFGLTILTVLVSGIPSYLTYLLYLKSGVDAFFGYPSLDPQFKQIMFILLYFGTVGCALSVLFFKGWFTFPLNFLSSEYDIVLDDKKISKEPAKGWFGDLMCWGFDPVYFTRDMEWQDITKIDYGPGVSFRLYPLPTTHLSAQSSLYKLLNKLAALCDSFGAARVKDHTLTITSHSGPTLSIRLFELTENQKVELFKFVCKHAPHAEITARAQEALVGSHLLKDPRHTELWFDMLTEHTRVVQAGGCESAESAASIGAGSTLRGNSLTVERLLGGGGQATVYLARNENGENVVLKEFVLTAGEGVEALVESVAEFEAESTILSRLDHEQIVKLKDLFIENNRAYLVIEYIQGQSLRSLVGEDGALPEDKVRELASQMCDVLSYMESQTPPVVHRDFTPDNLILQSDGRLKLIDFSISQLFQAATTAECAGKHAYTPPEQYRGQATPQSDIYAMGATLFFLLTGQDPEPISSSHPAALNAAISSGLDAVVAKATAINLSDRYESAAWVRMDV
ncbi:MAG: serine/threonine-protein kinase [Candidatus Obscuribacter sp.]|nr:serine/threonine-protein kinase [Candidatus Obscuribacter sp.]